MAINYRVRARVIDIARYAPRPTDLFVIDSNVWFWTSYTVPPGDPKAPQFYQLQEYPQFLKEAKIAGAALRWSALSWSELARLIESTEMRRDQVAGKIGEKVTLKDYRHLFPANRSRVAGEFYDAWSAVEQLAEPLDDFALGQKAVYEAEKEFPDVCLDGNDLFFVQAVRACKATALVTDDGDFCTVPDLTLITANKSVLRCAAMQGRLVASP